MDGVEVVEWLEEVDGVEEVEVVVAPTPGASPTLALAWTGRREQRCGRQCVSRPKARESARGGTVIQ